MLLEGDQMLRRVRRQKFRIPRPSWNAPKSVSEKSRDEEPLRQSLLGSAQESGGRPILRGFPVRGVPGPTALQGVQQSLNVNIGGLFVVFPRSQNQGFRAGDRSRPICWRQRGGRPGLWLLRHASTREQAALANGGDRRDRLLAGIGRLLDSTGCGSWHRSILGSAWPVFRAVDGVQCEVCARAPRPGPGRSDRNLAENLPDT